MTRRQLPDWAWTLAGIVLILAVWEIYGRLTNPFLFPSLTRVLTQLWIYVTGGELLGGFAGTMLLLFTGLALGTVAGVIFGLILGANRTLSLALAPFVQAAYATPRIALIPLIILWFGVGFWAQVVLVFLSCVFEVLTATEAGVKEISGQYFEVSRSFRLKRLQTFTKVIVPGSVSYIISGVRLGLGHAFVGAIGAEIFMQISGMGGMVRLAMQLFRSDQVLALILILAVAAALLMALMRLAQHVAVPWATGGGRDR